MLARIYAARGVQNSTELEKGLARLLPAHLLKGMDKAVQLLAQALEARQRILIVGDFDADGATASCVGMLGLRMLGAAHVDYLVPNRFDYATASRQKLLPWRLSVSPKCWSLWITVFLALKVWLPLKQQGSLLL